MPVVKFNINNEVRVRLTGTGKAILQKKYDDFHARFPHVTKPQLPQEDARGFSTWQMWDLMQTFEGHIGMGIDNPYELEIEIV